MHRRTVLSMAPSLMIERLVLRGFALADFDAQFAITDDPAVHRRLGGPVSRSEKWERFLRAPA